MSEVQHPQLETVKVDQIHEDPANANRRDDVDDLKASLQEFGQYQPIVAQRATGRILVGNHRYRALRELGHTECEVYYVDLDNVDATRLALSDNRTGERRAWDHEALYAQLTEVGVNIPGFDQDFYDDLQELVNHADLDTLHGEVGDPAESDWWPVIKIKLHPDLKAQWDAVVDRCGGDEANAMEHLLQLYAQANQQLA